MDYDVISLDNIEQSCASCALSCRCRGLRLAASSDMSRLLTYIGSSRAGERVAHNEQVLEVLRSGAPLRLFPVACLSRFFLFPVYIIHEPKHEQTGQMTHVFGGPPYLFEIYISPAPNIVYSNSSVLRPRGTPWNPRNPWAVDMGRFYTV